MVYIPKIKPPVKHVTHITVPGDNSSEYKVSVGASHGGNFPVHVQCREPRTAKGPDKSVYVLHTAYDVRVY